MFRIQFKSTQANHLCEFPTPLPPPPAPSTFLNVDPRRPSTLADRVFPGSIDFIARNPRSEKWKEYTPVISPYVSYTIELFEKRIKKARRGSGIGVGGGANNGENKRFEKKTRG